MRHQKTLTTKLQTTALIVICLSFIASFQNVHQSYATVVYTPMAPQKGGCPPPGFDAKAPNLLRNASFEEAGPREVVIPEGEFRDQNKNVVFLNPFTVPVGGNALAVLNLEARVPLTRAVQVVPFYDGGNVFRRIGDLFGKEDTTPVPPGDILAAINKANLRAHWTNTVGLGFRLQTPFGGALAVDYGFLLNPPEFLIPQRGPTSIFDGTPAIFRLPRGHLHFRITQTF